jgi:hypothetical protein
MANFDPEEFLNQPLELYSWQTTSMLGSVIDFLKWCEGNFLWQRHREIQTAKKEGAEFESMLPDEYEIAMHRNDLIREAKYQFEVRLAQSVRYAGLVAFVTALEWCAMDFRRRLPQKPPHEPSKENKHVHLLNWLNQSSSSGFDSHIDDLRRLVHVRNCVAHTAGFVDGYEYENELKESVKSLKGISIWDENDLGTSLCIEEGAVERYAEAAIEWVSTLDERCTTAGILK